MGLRAYLHSMFCDSKTAHGQHEARIVKADPNWRELFVRFGSQHDSVVPGCGNGERNRQQVDAAISLLGCSGCQCPPCDGAAALPPDELLGSAAGWLIGH
jgi:hypothetical protein